MATKKPLSGLSVARPRLRRAGLRLRIDADFVAPVVLVLELHHAVDQRIDREVRAEADVATRMPFGAALADDDVAANDFLAADLFRAAVLRIAVTTVARRAYAFLVSHYLSPFSPRA